MADGMNGTSAPALNDIDMKEETAETSIHSVPSAAQDTQAGAIDQNPTTTLPIDLPVSSTTPTGPTEQSAQPAATASTEQSTQDAPMSMEGILNGTEPSAPAPPVAQAPTASPLPATAAAPPAAPQSQLPVSAPTPPAPVTRPSSIPPSVSLPPEKPHAHGSPTRVYLNQTVTPHLLEGMKYLAAYEPEKPLKWLSEFLAKRSAEMEGEA